VTGAQGKVTQTDRVIIYYFLPRWRIFHFYGYVTIADEGLQNLGYGQRSGPLSKERSLSCPACCDTVPRFFWFHSKDPPPQISRFLRQEN
jgi:hypothetical protein